ncbi:MAG: metalloregulator ArsR/SmtB family transcription factor [Actinomycetota bacterium]
MTDAAPCCPPLLGPTLDEPDAEALAVMLKALADPVRLRLVNLIATAPEGEVCACDLPEQLGRSQPTISHHLSLLTRAGIVDRDQRGRWAWFRLRSEQLAALCVALDPACATR